MSELDFIVNLKGGMGYPRGILKKGTSEMRNWKIEQVVRYCLELEGLNDKEKQLAEHIRRDIAIVEEYIKTRQGEPYMLSIAVKTKDGGEDLMRKFEYKLGDYSFSVPLFPDVKVGRYIMKDTHQKGAATQEFDSLVIIVERIEFD